jgi:hypothetical protein
VLIVTDGDRDSPEVEYFFSHAPELEGWATVRHRPDCLDGQRGGVGDASLTSADCDVLFFSRTSTTSLDAFNLLACVVSFCSGDCRLMDELSQTEQ